MISHDTFSGMAHKLTTAVFALFAVAAGHAQVVINEVQVSNLQTIADDFGEFEDWFELYNAGSTAVNLAGYGLSDREDEPMKWPLPPMFLAAGQHRLIFASGRDLPGTLAPIDHFEAPVVASNTWQYLVPTAEPPAAWRNVGFDASGWGTGPGGFGFEDGDDGTTIQWPATSVYSRISFNLSDPLAVALMELRVDYDDAFVCYLNGVEIARAHIGTAGVPPAFSAFAADQHEAVVYQGGEADRFTIDYTVFASLLQAGENVLALQVHNVDEASSDLTENADLIVGMLSSTLQTAATSETIATESSATHANFGLSSGETLYLFNPAGELADSRAIPRMQTDHVLRRGIDGGQDWCFSTQGTPGSTNTGMCASHYALRPEFSIPSGLYSTAVYVALSTEEVNAEIRVTFDGSIPTQTSMLYVAPFAVTGTAVVSARTFSPNALPSHIIKNTYLINETEIGIPVVSLSTDPDNLWDPIDGIHVFGPPDYGGYPFFGANFWEDWEREGYIEYFDANHVKQMEGPIGVKIHGGWSRGRDQKSFRVQAKGKFGMERMEYPMIADKPHLTSFKGINLRNGGNDYDQYRFHDALMQRAMRTTDADYMGYTPVIVFLNGEYWGFMEMRENQDQHFAADNRDIPSNDVTVISHNYMGFNVISGDPASFFELHQYATQTPVNSAGYFGGLSDRLDIENYADYIIAQTYWGNGDWNNGWNNTKFFHDDRPGGKWRYMLMDLDFGMGLASGVNDNYLFGAANEGTESGQIFGASIQNTQFRNYFINRYADLINTVFQPDRVTAMAYEMRDEIVDIFQRHRIRWNTNGDALNGVLNDRLNWNQQRITGARNVVQEHYNLPSQVNITLNVLPAGAGRIHISTIEPEEAEYPWTGVYFNGVPVRITAVENPGYTFVNWGSNPILPLGSTEQSLELMFTTNLNFTANFQGSPVAEPLALTELMFNPDSQNDPGDWLELQNNMAVPLNLSGWTLKDDNFFNAYTFPLGTLIAPNTRFVLASDVAAFQAVHPDVANVFGPLNFSFSNSADQVNLLRPNGTAYIAFNYSDDDHPDLSCSDGCGHSRGHSGANLDFSIDQWYLECEGGSPGEAFAPCTYDLIISEINYDAPLGSNPGDWVELKNVGETAIDLSGYALRDRDDNAYMIPSGTFLEPNAHLVLARDIDAFALLHPNIENVLGSTAVAFSNDDDAVKIYNAENKLLIAMRYFNTAPWPLEAAGLGKTLEYDASSNAPCSPASWFAGCALGSPGVDFDPDCTVSVAALDAPSATIAVYPNPATATVNVVSDVPMRRIQAFDMRGQLVGDYFGLSAGFYTLDVQQWPQGIYLLSIEGEQNERTRVRLMVTQ
jgi:hypothetical protein